MSLDLSPEVERAIEQKAKTAGVCACELLARYFRPAMPGPGRKPDARARELIRTFRAWQEEDTTDDEEELARRDQERAELESNLDHCRRQAGMRPLYPGQG
jgi:hypothetical protein